MISGHQIHAYSAEISQIALQWAISQIHLPKDNKKISENKAVITNLCESVKLRKQAVKEGNGRGAGARQAYQTPYTYPAVCVSLTAII